MPERFYRYYIMQRHRGDLTRVQTNLAILYYAASLLNRALHSYLFERIKHYNTL